MRQSTLLILVLLVALLAASSLHPASASNHPISQQKPIHTPDAPAGLDPDFGAFDGDGVLVSPATLDVILYPAVQRDGKILAAGTVNPITGPSDGVVRRFNPDGSPDLTFGFNGRAIVDLGTDEDTISAIAVLESGKILLAGYVKGSGNRQAAVARLLSNGSLDTSFSGDGIAFAGLDAEVTIRTMALQPDGKIVLAGEAEYSSYYWTLFRFDIYGELDTSFDGDGKVVTDLGGGYIQDITLQTDGKIVAAGRGSNPMAVARYNSNGSLDTMFDGDGKLGYNLGDGGDINAVAVQADGKILVGGAALNKAAMVRLLSNGSFDTGYSGNGIAVTALSGEVWDLTLQPDGMAVAAANVADHNVLLRIRTDGSLDSGFSSDGMAGPDFPYATGVGWMFPASGVARMPDGRLVLAGTPRNGLNNHFSLARYFPDGALDSGGRAVLDFSPREAIGSGVAVASDGGILLAGTATWDDDDWAVGRLTAAGVPDPDFGPNTAWPGRSVLQLGGEQVASALALTALDEPVVAGYNQPAGDDQDFMVGRFTADGDPDYSFNSYGFNLTDFDLGHDNALALAIRPDGKLILAGSASNGSNDDFAVARYLPEGAIDTSFSTDGMAVSNHGTKMELARAVALQPGGKIVLAGGPDGDFDLRRFYANGFQPPFGSDLDLSFGSFGRVVDDFGGYDVAYALLAQPSGSLVAGGHSSAMGDEDFAISRYLVDGQLDTTFGSPAGGRVLLNFQPDSSDWLYALAQRGGDGLIAAVGCSNLGGTWRFAVAVLDRDGRLVQSFGNNGMALTTFGGVDDCARAAAFDSSGNILAAGTARMGGRDVYAVARYQAPAYRTFLPLARK